MEIKHLTPYLPYGLKVTFESDEYAHTLVGLVNWSDEIMVLSPFNDYGRSNIKNCKPILRPLSDLEKEMEIKIERGKMTVNGNTLAEMNYNEKRFLNNYIQELKYGE